MKFISENNLAALTGTSNRTVQKWAENGVYQTYTVDGVRGFNMENLNDIPDVCAMLNTNWNDEKNVTPLRQYNSIELFAGGGGLALGMSLAGLHHILLNEFDSSACKTLKTNKPEWNVIEGDIRHIDFTPLRGKVDFLSGGFPCQAFSYAGKQEGFSDTRGTLFFELARAVKEIQPLVFMGENVKGLKSHDDGRTFRTICNTISELGYTLVAPKVLKAIMYQVPQKRERLILIAIRNDVANGIDFQWPSPFERVLTLRDALFRGIIFDQDVPASEGAKYPEKKSRVLDLVPQGGDWRDLPENIAKEYMGGSWHLGGGKTGMARRLSLNEPSLTLTCSPCQKQTERCHPLETRPLNVREYARIQTFPDSWQFKGTLSDKYKQIGNAVPVNLAWAIGRSIIRLLNSIQRKFPSQPADYQIAVEQIISEQSRLVVTKDNKTQTSTVNTSCKQLNLFELYELFGEKNIITGSFVQEDVTCYGCQKNEQQSIDKSKKVLIALIDKNNAKSFVGQAKDTCYTSEIFPDSIALNQQFYFMPYIKGKGFKNLYLVKSIRVCKGKKNQDDFNGFTLVFELEFHSGLYNKFHSLPLDIWGTFNFTTIDKILALDTK